MKALTKRFLFRMDYIHGCFYVTAQGSALAWTQVLPTLISLSLSLLTFFNCQVLFLYLGVYLHAFQLLLWSIQLALRIDRPDPICQEYHTYSFPSIESFYIAALVTFLIGYSVFWNVRQKWSLWLTVFIFFIVPPTVLVFFSFNVWYEVVISLGIGVIATFLFIIFLYVYIQENSPYYLNIFPLNWIGYKDDYLYIPTSKKGWNITKKVSQIKNDIAVARAYCKRS